MDKKRPLLSRPPLTPEKKEKLAKQIIEGAGGESISEAKKNKPITLRLPESHFRDIKKIASFTGLTRNSVWIDVIRIGLREKLKELDL
jgi:hypothetical protein